MANNLCPRIPPRRGQTLPLRIHDRQVTARSLFQAHHPLTIRKYLGLVSPRTQSKGYPMIQIYLLLAILVLTSFLCGLIIGQDRR